MSARLDLDFMYVDQTKRKLSLHNTKYCLVSPHCPKSQQVLRSSWFSSSATSFLKIKKKMGQATLNLFGTVVCIFSLPVSPKNVNKDDMSFVVVDRCYVEL